MARTVVAWIASMMVWIQVLLGLGAFPPGMPGWAQSIQPALQVVATTVVSDCTEGGLDAALLQGGKITFRCGSVPVTIRLTSEKHIAVPTSLHGGVTGDVILSSVVGRPGGFLVPAGSSLAVHNLIFVAPGIVNQGEVLVTHSIFRDGTSRIENQTRARLSIADSTFRANERGVVNHGVATVHRSTFENNTVGIHNLETGTVTVTQSYFSNHTAAAAISNHGGRLRLRDSTFAENGNNTNFFSSSLYIEGGTVTVRQTTFRRNGSGGSGGAITNFHGTVRILYSTFAQNSSQSGGAIHYDGGGGLTIIGCTFNKNRARQGGAIVASGPVRITNSTFYSNSARTTGGAIEARAALSITNSTVYDNTAVTSASAIATSDEAQVHNTIVAGRTADHLCTGTITGDNNLQWPGNRPRCGPGFHFADPQLGPLAYHGGPTRTLAPVSGSAAIDAVPPGSPCPGTDQRRLPRPVDGEHNGNVRCDIGAVEVQ